MSNDNTKKAPPKVGGNVLINGRTAVHAGSGGVLTTVDVCLTKIGHSTVPIPYTNIARSEDAAQTASTVFINGHPVCHKNSIFAKSTGDEPGNRKGIKSGTITEKAEFVTASSNVYIEGIAAVRQGDYMVSNNSNTAPMPLSQPGAPRPKTNSLDDVNDLNEADLPDGVPLKISGTSLHIQNDLIAIGDGKEDEDFQDETGTSAQTAAGGGHAGSATATADNDPVSEPTKPELVIGVFFDGTGNNMLAQPPEQQTNVAKLYDMYPLATTAQVYRRHLYVEGVGTKAVSDGNGNFKEDDSALGLATGLGGYGAGPRLLQARDELHDILKAYQRIHGLPEQVTFDVFGFSRGAVLARHFANQVQAGLPDLLQPLTRERSPIWPSLRSAKAANPAEDMSPAESLYPRLAAQVRVRFLGLFDSVGSFGTPGDADEGFVNPYLGSATADHVYQVTARDEIRENFPLTRIFPGSGSWVEEESFGVHSDIGGGYDNTPEHILIAGARDQYRSPYPFDYYDWQREMKKRAVDMSQKFGIDCQVEFHTGMPPATADFFEVRRTSNQLALVALKMVYDQALLRGVPLRPMPLIHKIPPNLRNLILRAKTGDPAALKQLDDDYIHTSHRGFCATYFRETIGLNPEADGCRDIFPNQPERAIVCLPTQVRTQS